MIVLFLIFTVVAYLLLDAYVPHSDELRWHRVGGLTHWRFGRFGGTFYRKARNAR